jgi:hypothetical protein
MPDIINKVMSLVTGGDDGNSDKDILLKQLAKEIAQNRYAKFYRVRQNEVDASLGQFFYSVYKTVYPLQIFLRDSAKASRIRQITLEAFLDKKVMDILKRLSPEGIAERRKSVSDSEELKKQLEEDLNALAVGFDSPRIAAADKCYNLIAALKQFVNFDFCSLLKKFDPEIKEGDFLTQPKISPVEGEIIMPNISAFMSVIPPSEPNDDR